MYTPDASLQVDSEDYSNEVCTLQTAAQSFTKVDGQLVRLFLNSPVVLQPEKVCALGHTCSVPHLRRRLNLICATPVL